MSDASRPTAGTPSQSSGVLLDYLARLMRIRFESAIRPDGLRPRHLIALTLLRELGGRSTQTALAAALQIDRSNAVGLLNDLERLKLVVRRRDTVDRRRHIVELTARGAKELVAAEQHFAVAEDEVLSALSPAQRETLHELLMRATAGQAVECREDTPPRCTE